ncbi:unnamed protein product [Echinostoma caproni]|uniref:BRCT domain-containing protein n=1 Tax=Echinostoma caproni TaxID=27848 RepID=A0A183A9B5_9TREM|nr:unnamed protein product [Echinostoma caproni]
MPDYCVDVYMCLLMVKSVKRHSACHQHHHELSIPKYNDASSLDTYQTQSSSTVRATNPKSDTVGQQQQHDHSEAPRFILNHKTVFTLGSSANAWLGMGAARGRIYTKHPELFRYQCDAEDKAWLVRNGLLASHGVKAYLMHSDQVKHIGLVNGRIPSPSTNPSQSDSLPSFTVPAWLVQKVITAADNGSFAVEPELVAASSQNTPKVFPDRPASVDHAKSDVDNLSSRLSVESDELSRHALHDHFVISTGSKSRHFTSSNEVDSASLSGSTHSGSGSRRSSGPVHEPHGKFVLGRDQGVWSEDSRMVESRKTNYHSTDQRSKILKCATRDNSPVRPTVPPSSSTSASRGTKTSHGHVTLEYHSGEKSPKSPPTLKRFDYT